LAKLSGSALGKFSHPGSNNSKSDFVISGTTPDDMFYEFPVDSDNIDLRKQIGFASGKLLDVTGFNCGNCGVYLLGLCTKFHIKVDKVDCCGKWEK